MEDGANGIDQLITCAPKKVVIEWQPRRDIVGSMMDAKCANVRVALSILKQLAIFAVSIGVIIRSASLKVAINAGL